MVKEQLQGFEPLPLDLQGWNGNAPTFKNLVHEVRPKRIIEVGTWKGASTVSLAKACKELGLDTHITAIDTWLGSLEFQENQKLFGAGWDRMLKFGYPQVYYQFLSNIIHEGVVDMIDPLPMVSLDAARYVPDNLADLIYLDASHDFKSVYEDLCAYWPKLRVGGIIFGDDYWLSGNPHREDKYRPDVKGAVDKFMSEFPQQMAGFEILENNFWVIRKI